MMNGNIILRYVPKDIMLKPENPRMVLIMVAKYNEEGRVEKENIEFICRIVDGILLIQTVRFLVIVIVCIWEILCIVGICDKS